MKLVYTHENKIIVDNAKNYLDEARIESIMRNEYSSGGMGELPPVETWPEIWVDDDVYLKAKSVIDKLLNGFAGAVWICSSCSEENEPTFEVCWNCQKVNFA